MKREHAFFCLILFILFAPASLSAQGLKGKFKGAFKKDKADLFECGRVYKEKTLSKLNPMKALQKGLGGSFTGETSQLSQAGITVFYHAHLYPRELVSYVTKTPNWQTCGDAVYVGMTNAKGVGILKTDGEVNIDGQMVEHAGVGTYFHGFPDTDRGTKKVSISSSNGEQVEVSVEPAIAFKIISVNGKKAGEEVTFDGKTDIEILLENGDADPTSRLHVSMVSRSVNTRLLYDIFISKAQNRIVIPKEAFFNYEGSPTPFSKNNVLIINRVQEKIIGNSQAGALRTLSFYTDWRPITMEGDLTSGSIMVNGFDQEKNKQITFEQDGAYRFQFRKQQPFYAPPLSNMKKVAVASFFIRATMTDTKTQKSATLDSTFLNVMRKNFPEYGRATWKGVIAKLYDQFTSSLSREMGIEFVPIEAVTSAASYQYMKPIADDVNFFHAELGHQGTQRLLSTSGADFMEDLGITFPGDFVANRLQRELGVDAIAAVTIDLTFDFDAEAMNPSVNIAFMGPGSYKQNSQYFQASGSAKAYSLTQSNQEGGLKNRDRLYYMIRGDELVENLIAGLKTLQAKESSVSLYEQLWMGMK
ncbi:MAG: hypothetical protein AAF206_14600 [Bacteroidota bacterium]